MEKGALSHRIFSFHNFLIYKGLITLAANIGMFSIVKKKHLQLSFQNILLIINSALNYQRVVLH